MIGVLGAIERDPEFQERGLLGRGRGRGRVGRRLRRLFDVVAVCCCCCLLFLLPERRRELARRVQRLFVSFKERAEGLRLGRVGVERLQIREERRSAPGDEPAGDGVGGRDEALALLEVEDRRRDHRRPRVVLPDDVIQRAQGGNLFGSEGSPPELREPQGPAHAVVAPGVVGVAVEELPPGALGLLGARRAQGLEAAGSELAGAPVRCV